MKRNSYYALAILLLSHSPLKWLSNAILILIAIVTIKRNFRLKKIEAIIIISICSIFLIGTLLNLAKNQNISGIILSAYLLSPNIIFPILYSKIQRNLDLYKVLRTFTLIQSVFLALQYSAIAFKSGTLNIYRSDQSSGDYLAGTFLSFSTPLAVSFSFISVYFLTEYFNKSKLESATLSLLAIIIIATTGAMSILLIDCIVVFSYITFKTLSRSSSRKAKLILIASILLTSIPISSLISSNIGYTARLQDRMLNKELPFKFEIAKHVLDGASDFDNFFYGIGIGNYVSRASLFLSGQYLDQQYMIPISPSKELKKDILPYFSVKSRGQTINGYDSLSVVSEPFNQYISILSESGAIGIFIFFYMLASITIISLKKYNSILPHIAIAAATFITNSWLEYISFSAVFLLIISANTRGTNYGPTASIHNNVNLRRAL